MNAAVAFDELDAALRAHDEAQWEYALAPDGSDESSEAHEVCARAQARLDAAIEALRALVGVPR